MTVALTHRHWRRRTEQARPRCACFGSRFRRGTLSTIDRFQVRRQRPGRTRIAGIVFLQKQIKREFKALFGKAARAAMASHAAFGKQFCRRLAPIEVLRKGHRSAERHRDCQNEKTAAHSVEPHRLFPFGDAARRGQRRRDKMAGAAQSAGRPWRKMGALPPLLRCNRGKERLWDGSSERETRRILAPKEDGFRCNLSILHSHS